MQINEVTTISILGRQPALGIAELESLYGPENVRPFSKNMCLLTMNPEEIDFARLGGSIKLAKILSALPNDWNSIEKYLIEKCPEFANYAQDKLSFGISVYGVNVSPKKLANTALQVKKAIKSTGHSVRMVPHKTLELGSATVIHNKLTNGNNWELLIVSNGEKTFLAQTTNIQDIEAYTARDQARPFRDAKVGMLPPKLAQIIINLATRKTDINPISGQMFLDPFCGTGVVLQEALLMGYLVHGSDIESRMIDYTQKNIDWLYKNIGYSGTLLTLDIADATSFKWIEANIVDSIACETYLGKPLSTLPPGDQLSKIMQEVNTLHHKFLENIGKQINSGTRLCLAIPTWRGKHEFLHLKVLDFLSDLGYNRVKFEHVRNEDLIYHREGQVVGRELLVLTRS